VLWLNFWLQKESFQLKLTAEGKLFMVRIMLTWALCIGGPTSVRMTNWEKLICLIDNKWSCFDSNWSVLQEKVELTEDKEQLLKEKCCQAWYFTGMCGSHYLCFSVYKGLCKMGFLCADCRDENFECWNLPATSVVIWEQRWEISLQ
jgi:hypothetical protein